MAIPRVELLLSHRQSDDRQRIAEAAAARGITVRVLQSFRAPKDIRPMPGLRIYAEPMFADVIGSQVGLGVIEPPLAWLATVSPDFLGREVGLSTLGQVRTGNFPLFVKSVDDKHITPRVYRGAEELPGLSIAADSDVVLTSQPASWSTEIRLFVLDGEVKTGSSYLLDGKPTYVELSKTGFATEVTSFASRVFAATAATLPSALVMDLGIDEVGRVSVVELNAASGSGLYASDANEALDVILSASVSGSERSTVPPQFLRQTVDVDFGL